MIVKLLRKDDKIITLIAFKLLVYTLNISYIIIKKELYNYVINKMKVLQHKNICKYIFDVKICYLLCFIII